MSRRRLFSYAVPALLSVGLACSAGEPTVASELAAYRTQRGELSHVTSTEGVPRGRYVAEGVRLESSTGLVATGRVYHPLSVERCLPAVLLQDGREENSGVIARLPSEFGDVVVLSLDYPAEIPYTIRLPDVMRHTERLQRAAHRIPALFSLGATYLSGRPDVDSARIALAATSFAVPFATIAAAMDPRFRNIALIYGAGDMPRVLAANLPGVPAALRSTAARVAVEPFSAFAPERFIGRIAPRPTVMINGIDDPQMPVAAVRRLYDAAQQPKSIVWLPTGHLMSTDSSLIRQLIDTAFARLPVLRDSATGGSCSSATETSNLPGCRAGVCRASTDTGTPPLAPPSCSFPGRAARFPCKEAS